MGARQAKGLLATGCWMWRCVFEPGPTGLGVLTAWFNGAGEAEEKGAGMRWEHALLVMLGGGVGAVLRWCAGLMLVRVGGSVSQATLLVNVVGSLAMGVLLAWFQARPSAHWQLLLTTGVLGGLTTFSTFSAEWLQLWQRGAVWGAWLHVLAHVGLALLAVTAGHALVQRWMAA
jgi:CrcB protein